MFPFNNPGSGLLRYRKWIILIFQALMILGAFFAAFVVRFEFQIPSQYLPRIHQLLIPLIVIKLFFFWSMGLFRGWWRYVSMPDLVQIVKANFFGSASFVFYIVLVYRLELVPRSVLILDGIFCFLAIAGVRFFTRAVREQYFPMGKDLDQFRKRVLVYGAGTAGQMIAREIRTHPQFNLEVVGYLDDDRNKKNSTFQGLAVLGNQQKVDKIVKEYLIDEIIIAVPSASGRQICQLVELCRATDANVKILPGVEELIDGRVSIQQIRDIDLNDLLGRQPIKLDEQQIDNFIRDKRILITGAGGTIGSEICRQLARYCPGKLILFENAETALFRIEQELAGLFPELTIVPIVGDVRNRSRVQVIFDEQMPQVVFHAAAYKHVPLMEMNPAEAVNNNVQGTRLLADAADQFKVEKFVMISTDKAVRPANVMGSSKRVAELYVQALNQRSQTRFVTTRFGNVLGSNGSVIPTFKEQIARGGPVTVTDPEVTRYFMTIPEATQLVLQAGSMGQGGEIYLFDMGEPVKILTLAEELIRLSGLQPYDDIDISYIGLRPGEKLFEELLLDEEGALPTPHSKICIAQSVEVPYPELLRQLDALVADAKVLDLTGVRQKLSALVPEYCPAQNKEPAKVIQHPATKTG